MVAKAVFEDLSFIDLLEVFLQGRALPGRALD